MSRLAILGLVFLTAVLAKPPGPRPEPPRGPEVRVPPKVNATQGGDLSFDFAISGMEPLNVSVIHVVKIISRDVEPEAVRFDVQLTSLTEEEIAEITAEEEAKHEGHDHEGEPRPHPKYIVKGTVTGSGLTCDDQSRYQIAYGKPEKKGDRREDLLKRREGGEGERRPRPPPGSFVIDVEGCEKPTEPQPEKRSRDDKDGGRPKPRPKGPEVRVPPKVNATQGGDLSFDFAISGMEPLNVSVIHVVKIISRDVEPEAARFDVQLTTLTEEEIAEITAEEEAKHEGHDHEGEPRSHPKYIVQGTVTGSGLTCDDQSRYQIAYGKPEKKGDRREDLLKRREGGEGERRPRPPPGAFVIDVEGCEKPTEPQPEI